MEKTKELNKTEREELITNALGITARIGKRVGNKRKEKKKKNNCCILFLGNYL